MSAAAYQGPVIPLVEHAGGPGALARTYVLDGAGSASDASGLRPEIAPLMDHGLYGSANTAFSYFEAHGLPRSPCAALAALIPPRRRFQLGVHADADIHVAEDRSADLGLALAFYGASSAVPLSHVVATGSLRRSEEAETSSAPGGKIHMVSGLEQKARLVESVIERSSGGEVVFMFPRPALEEVGSLTSALERLSELAGTKGIAFRSVPVDTMAEALRELGIRRQTGGGVTCIAAGLAVLAVAGYFGASAYMNRPLALRWDQINRQGTLVQLPLMAVPQPGTSGKRQACAIARGPDQIARVPVGAQLLFAVAEDAGELPAKTSMALVAVFETSAPSVLPLTSAGDITVKGKNAQWRNYTFEAAVEAPSEYSRLIVVARRFGAVNLDVLTDKVGEIAGAEQTDRIAAVSNYLRTEYPGYVEFGYRSTDEDVPCTPAF